MGVRRGISILIAVVAVTLGPQAEAFGATPKPCNGHPALCSRTLDSVVLPGTHNSMAAEELGWTRPNQTFAIPGQLRRGARAFLIDTYYGRERFIGGENVVREIPKEEGRGTGAEMYLCHVFCNLGASKLVDVFRSVRDFLKANPREVLIFVNQDAVASDDFATKVSEAGLLPYVYRGSVTEWPTLDQMIATGQRVVFLAESDAGTVPWYHRAYGGPMRETPYTWGSAAQLTEPGQLFESCRPLRGGDTGRLFLMNHWVLVNGIPIREIAEQTNAKEALVARARACEERRGSRPTILAVDFFGTGDVVGAALELNGLEPWVAPKPPPRLTAAQIAKKARAACRKRKPARARKACIAKQTAKLKKQNGRSRT
jgi:hypothetical protein